MTKQFTAASILQLVDAGKFTLDTDVRQLLPEAQLTHGPLNDPPAPLAHVGAS